MTEKGRWHRMFSGWLPVAVWAFLIFLLSVSPYVAPGCYVAGLDKAAHFCAYAVLVVLVVRAARPDAVFFFARMSLFALISCGGYGILMELAQHFVPGRDVSAADAATNIIGAGAGMILGKKVLWRK